MGTLDAILAKAETTADAQISCTDRPLEVGRRLEFILVAGRRLGTH